jgi:C1A family cysteine protease
MTQTYQGDGQKRTMSAFHGRPLAGIERIDIELLRRLAALGIQDSEQLLALVAVDTVPMALAQYLSIPGDNLTQIVADARKALPRHVAELLERPSEFDFHMGAIAPTEASQGVASSLMKAVAARAVLPSSVNHAGSMAAVQNQGMRGTCVAFGATAVHEYYRVERGSQVKLSEQFLYEEIKKIDGLAEECGTWLAYGMQVLANLGECSEAVWSYNPNPPCNHNFSQPEDARAEAARYRVQGQMLNSKDVNGIKTALASGSNVAFCIPVYNSWYRSAETVRTGRITMRISDEPIVNGHCMCLVGYQDDPPSPGGGYFILRNSWGPNTWGSQCPYGLGNGTIPYQYIADDAFEAAAILDSGVS